MDKLTRERDTFSLLGLFTIGLILFYDVDFNANCLVNSVSVRVLKAVTLKHIFGFHH